MKALSAMLAIVLLVGLFPTSVIAELLPDIVPDMNGDGVVNNIDEDIFATVQQGKVVSATPYNASSGYVIDGKLYDTNQTNKTPIVDASYSPYEPYSTNDPNHPFLTNGAAWINLEELFYGAPATPNYPITKWSANTSVYNTTATTLQHECGCTVMKEDKTCAVHPGSGQTIYAFADNNLINEYLWASQSEQVYKNYHSAGEYNDNDGKGNYDWVTENGVVSSAKNAFVQKDTTVDGATVKQNLLETVTSKNGTTAYVYNRYDPMQGKWGLTLDKNVSSVTFDGTWRPNYYKDYSNINSSELYLTDTPYLYYSTEAPDSTQIAISLLIGTPVQTEYKSTNQSGLAETNVIEYVWKYDETTNLWTRSTFTEYASYQPEYVYRWYTITDDALRPGIDTNTLGYSMIPNVHISEPVLENYIPDSYNSAGTVLNAIANGYMSNQDSDPSTSAPGIQGGATVSGDINKLNPIKLADTDLTTTADTESLYVNGSITGCIDFTQILPLLMGTVEQATATTGVHAGRYIYQVSTDHQSYASQNGAYYYYDKATGKLYNENNVESSIAIEGGNVLVPVYDSDEGRQDVCYKIAQVRIDTKTDTATYTEATDSAARINYLYFGPGQSAVYTPQSTVGSDVNAANWQYGQNEANIGDSNANNVAHTQGRYNGVFWNYNAFDGGYTNGWENGEAVSITNKPNQQQLITIDTYGISGGKLIDYPTATGTITDSNNNTTTYTYINYTKGSIGEQSKIWQYQVSDGNGGTKTVQLEAEYNSTDDQYYAMVTIPIRKWIDVLGASRKLSFTLTMERYAANNPVDPNFCLWGNNDGALGAGHSDFGTRYRNEDMICVFGSDGYYQVDNNGDFQSVLIDKTIGDSVVYNGESIVTLHHRPERNSGDTTIVPLTDCHVYVDANGTYYYQYGGAWYTATQETTENGNLMYFHDAANGDPTYEYNPTTRTLVDGDGYVADGLSLGVLTPLYVLNEVTTELPELSVVYDSTESWFDMLRSPYMFTANRVLTGSNTGAGINDNSKVGYVFVTALRIAVPVGSTFTIQNMKGDGNSAGLNMYSTSGAVVNAYDGGAGVQPEINTTTQKDEKSFNSSYATQAFGDGVVKSTQSESAAAYGPYLVSSNYTIYDLLDTEWIDKNSNGTLQAVVGIPFRENASSYDSLATFAYPYGYTEPTATTSPTFDGDTTISIPRHDDEVSGDFMVYGTITINDTNGTSTGNGGKETWGLVSTSGYEFAWVKLAYTYKNVYKYYNAEQLLYSYGSTNISYEGAQAAYGNVSFAFQKTYDTIHFTKDSNGNISSCYFNNDTSLTLNSIIDEMKDKWTYSRYVDVSGGGSNVSNVYSSKGTPPMMSSIPASGTNSFINMAATRVSVANSTDMLLSYSTTEAVYRAASITRTFSTPIRLTNAAMGTEKTWPVLYYDFTNIGSNGAVQVAVTVRVDNQTKVYYVTGGGALSENCTTLWGGYCGYASFKNIMNGLGYTAPGSDKVIDVVGVTVLYSRSNSDGNTGEMTIRRLEIWQDDVAWLGVINNDNGANGQLNSEATNMAATVADGFNIINDAFYYVDRDMTNKGWSAVIRANGDGDTAAYYNSSDADHVDGVYEYRTSLGHLRVWVPGGKEAKVLFSSDRSFNTDKYKYLYYSYSMRDIDTGIAAEQSTGNEGIGIVLKQDKGTASNLYMQQYDSWTYYPVGVDYAANLEYKTVMNAAVDLSSLDGIDSINQIVLHLNNKNQTTTAEFYINYIYLSNVPPSANVSTQLTETQYQYYYLMDNTGGRYSARFPTLDNPTGQITGGTNQTRVNPIRVKRGDNFYEGTYNNGEPLGGSYGDKSGTTDQYYANTYGDPASTDQAVLDQLKEYLGVVDTDSYIRMYWFYGAQDEENPNRDIQDYYRYKDRDGNGVGNKYDMLWSYGRWYTGAGESALNTMYIEEAGTGAQQADYIYGNLVRRYATENYVLLRSGIEPKKDLTYYNTDGGQMHYAASGTELGTSESISVNEHDKSYFITETVLFDYFSWPVENSAPVNPTKYGYVFDGWYFTELLPSAWTDKNKNGIYDYGEMKERIWTDTDGDMIPDAGEILSSDYWTDLDGDGTFDFEMELQTFTKKQTPGANYFYAKWTADPTFTVDGKRLSYTANFLNAANESWLERTTDEDFQIRLPSVVQMNTASGVRMVAGWKAYGVKADGTEVAYTTLDLATGKTYTPVYESGSWITLKLKDTDYVSMNFKPVLKDPETDDETGETAGLIGTITVTNGQLWLYTGTGDAANGYGKNDPNNQKIFHTTDDSTNTRTYYNVPKNVVFVAEPTITKEQDKSYGWVMSNPQDGKTLQLDTTLRAVLSTTDEYLFTASNLTMALSYDVLSTKEITESATGMVTTFTGVKPVNREMTFYSQYQELEGYTVEAFGTLYVRGSKNYTTIQTMLTSYLKLKETDLTADNVLLGSYETAHSAVRHIKASGSNTSDQYGLSYTDTTYKETTVYMRGYVIYSQEVNGEKSYHVKYSNYIIAGTVAADDSDTSEAA